MSSELFRQGGPHNVRRTGSETYEFSISVPKDQHGRTARECPGGRCSPGFFKVKCGTGVKNQTKAFCPYCRASGKPSDFTTKEQVRYARQIVEAQAHEGVERMMKEALVGDAVGTTLEFKSPGTFEPITDMIGGHPFRLKPGEWTDDTSMALCLAASCATPPAVVSNRSGVGPLARALPAAARKKVVANTKPGESERVPPRETGTERRRKTGHGAGAG